MHLLRTSVKDTLSFSSRGLKLLTFRQKNFAQKVDSHYMVSVSRKTLYNNTCSFCIFIGRELCVIKVHTHG